MQCGVRIAQCLRAQSRTCWTQQLLARASFSRHSLRFSSSGNSAGGVPEEPTPPPPSLRQRLMAGLPPRPPLKQTLTAAAGSFCGIGSIAMLHSFGLLQPEAATLLVGSFGATAALIFAVPNSPFAQPVSAIGGHAVSAFVGVATLQVIGSDVLFLAAPIAVASSIFAMQNLRCFHPPGAATALITILAPAHVHSLGWSFVLFPAASVPALLVLGGTFFFRLKGIKYPAI